MKKKILVPIDFSRTSFSAYAYSCHLAELMDYEITILHVISGTFTTQQLLDFSPIMDSRENAIEHLQFFAKEYEKDFDIDLPDVHLNYEIRFGIPGFTISDYANDNQFDLIVIGTKDKNSMLNRVLGSSSSTVISVSKCPVLLIHEHTQFHKPEKIVFGITTKTDIEDAINDFDALNKNLGAAVEFLHILPKNDQDSDVAEVLEGQVIEELLDNDHPSYPIKFKTLHDKSPAKAMKHYAVLQNVDILAMVHRHKGPFYRLFHPSTSIRVGQDLQLPVLVFSE